VHTVRTPMAPDQLSKVRKGDWSEEEAEKVEVTKYLQLPAAFEYAAGACRPDIAFATSALASASPDPRAIHYKAALRVLKYLQQTKEWVLRYTRGHASSKLKGFE